MSFDRHYCYKVKNKGFVFHDNRQVLEYLASLERVALERVEEGGGRAVSGQREGLVVG